MEGPIRRTANTKPSLNNYNFEDDFQRRHNPYLKSTLENNFKRGFPSNTTYQLIP